jgi:hypothetical protein
MLRVDLRSGVGTARATVSVVWWAVGSMFRRVWFDCAVRCCFVVGRCWGSLPGLANSLPFFFFCRLLERDRFPVVVLDEVVRLVAGSVRF